MRNTQVSELVKRELERRGIKTSVRCDTSEICDSTSRCHGGACLLVLDEVLRHDRIAANWDKTRLVLVHASHGYLQDETDEQSIHLCKPIRPSQFDRIVAKLEGSAKARRCRSQTEASKTRKRSPNFGKILLVEDNAVNRKLVEKLLERLGYSCDQAVDGIDALECCEKRSYDLILLDCSMPRMDGYEFARQFRAKEKSRGSARTATRIIALTANAMQGDRERCLDAGMDDYLTKPLKKATLEAALIEAFGDPVLN